MNRLARAAALLLMLAAVPAAAANWAVDPARSRLGFTATWLGKPVEGTFKTWNARIAFDPAAPETASIDVGVDLASAVTGDRTVDGALPDSDWFAVKRGSQARFVASSVRKTPTGWVAAGTLTLKGRSAPVELPFTLAVAGTSPLSTAARGSTGGAGRSGWDPTPPPSMWRFLSPSVSL